MLGTLPLTGDSRKLWLLDAKSVTGRLKPKTLNDNLNPFGGKPVKTISSVMFYSAILSKATKI